jgi:hypothetical protein
MSDTIDRRDFVTRALTAAAATGLGELSFLSQLPAVSAADARPAPATVQFSPDTEPLVRLIEETPREKLLEKVAGEVRQGTSYQQLLTAAFLAGVRGIRPRPVGFKFHAVLVINSAHLASLAAADRDRWLPLFWALDNFKSSQAANAAEGGWMLPPAQDGKLPPPHLAKQRFVEAMDAWDEEGTDRAVTALARSASPGEVIELFYRYGCRDFRDIGHKAIYVANGWRTLQAIGWRHAEPVLRSLAYALLEHEGGNPAQRDDERDRPFRDNQKRVADVGPLWRKDRKPSAEASADLLATLRYASAPGACDAAAEILKCGVHPDSVWDGLFLTAGELLARQPGIIGVHCLTSMNALHYASGVTADDATRRMLMLQGAAFLALFRQFMVGRGGLADLRLDRLEKSAPGADVAAAVEELFAAVSKDRTEAAEKALGLLEGHPERMPAVMAAARRLVFSKGRDSHDYKFSSAVLEDYYHVGDAWRPRFAAAAMFNLRGSGEADTDLVRRARAALG